MTIHVLETSGLVSGHQAGWLRVVLESLSELGAEVCLLSPDPGEWFGELPGKNVSHAPVWRHRDMAFFSGLGRIRPLPSSVVFLRYLRLLSAMETLHSTSSKHLVFNHWDVFHSQIPYVNRILLSRIKVPWSAFWLWPNPAKVGSGLFTKNLSTLFYLTEQDRGWMDSLTKGRAVWLPDFAADTSIATSSKLAARLQLAARGQPVVTLAGALSRRKGVMRFLRLADEARKQNVNIVFALVGDVRWQEFSRAEVARLKSIIHQSPDNMFVHLQTVQKEPDFNALLAASAVIYLLYENYRYSSNLLAKAAAFRVPVLAPAEGVLCSRTRTYSLGGIIRESDSDAAILMELRRLSASGPLGRVSCQEYLTLHSRIRFKKSVKRAFAKAL